MTFRHLNVYSVRYPVFSANFRARKGFQRTPDCGIFAPEGAASTRQFGGLVDLVVLARTIIGGPGSKNFSNHPKTIFKETGNEPDPHHA